MGRRARDDRPGRSGASVNLREELQEAGNSSRTDGDAASHVNVARAQFPRRLSLVAGSSTQRRSSGSSSRKRR